MMMKKKKEHEEKWNKEKDKNTKLEREGRLAFRELLIKPTRNCSRDIYGLIV